MRVSVTSLCRRSSERDRECTHYIRPCFTLDPDHATVSTESLLKPQPFAPSLHEERELLWVALGSQGSTIEGDVRALVVRYNWFGVIWKLMTHGGRRRDERVRTSSLQASLGHEGWSMPCRLPH